MKFTCGLTFKLPMLLVLLMLVVATKGHTVLQCYVCDNCEKVDKTTPLEQCGGENFSTTTTTTTTTTMLPSESTTTMASNENFSTTTKRSTSMTPTDSTVKPSTAEDPITPNTTVVELTIPPVNAFTSTTINPSTTPIILDTKNETSDANNSTTLPSLFVTPSSEGRSFIALDTGLITARSGQSPDEIHNRQRRHTEFNGITYYCYKIQKKYDNVFGTKRGCIGVKTELSVCDELDSSNNNQTNKCSPCTNTMCNGSSAVGVSIVTTLLVALLALIFKV